MLRTIVRTGLLSAFAAALYAPAAHAQSGDSPQVRFSYIVPSDKTVNDAYVDGIKKAALSIQTFYSEQLGGQVFSTTHPTVEVIESNNDTAWYAAAMWNRSRETAGAIFGDPNNIYIIYVDADADCDDTTGIGGTNGVALLPANDLRGLVGEPTVDSCEGIDTTAPIHRWIGGLGHELGHALGLPHPEGCNEGLASCDSNSIMWLGFVDYPETYVGARARETLSSSGFFSPQYGSPLSLPLTDTFESAVTWHNTSDADWMTTSGNTPTIATGPRVASEGTRYAYLETSNASAGEAGDVAYLESDVFDARDAKLAFSYHMFGRDIGTLAVEVSQNGIWQTIWSRAGQQHASSSAAWSDEVVRLDAYRGSTKVRFRATAAGGPLGDIAIDGIRLHTGVEVLNANFDGTWFYAEWTPVSYANNYTQFVVGESSAGSAWLHRINSGSNDRGDFSYQFYHKDEICAALGAPGRYDLQSQIWPESDSALAGGRRASSAIVCP